MRLSQAMRKPVGCSDNYRLSSGVDADVLPAANSPAEISPNAANKATALTVPAKPSSGNACRTLAPESSVTALERADRAQ